MIVTYEALSPDGRAYGTLAGKRSSPLQLGPWRDRHDPGWELVGPQHATAADAARARELER